MAIFKKKITKAGMQIKARSRLEVESEYQQQALHAGHKSRMIVEYTQLIDRLQEEVEVHIRTMRTLDLEFKASAPTDSVESKGPTEPTLGADQ